jgi:hypothetical protein
MKNTSLPRTLAKREVIRLQAGKVLGIGHNRDSKSRCHGAISTRRADCIQHESSKIMSRAYEHYAIQLDTGLRSPSISGRGYCHRLVWGTAARASTLPGRSHGNAKSPLAGLLLT